MVSSENWQVKPRYFPPADFSSQATHPKLKIASAQSAQTIHEPLCLIKDKLKLMNLNNNLYNLNRFIWIIFLLSYSQSLHSQNPSRETSSSVNNEIFLYSEPEEVGVSSEQLLQLGDKVSNWVSQGDPVGAEVLIIKNGRIIFHEAYGWSDRERNIYLEKKSIYRIRSMTKPFISTATLMLVEEGKIVLNNSISEYLTSFDKPETRSITVRELLTQTSGFGNNELRDTQLPKSPDEYNSLQALVEDIALSSPLGPRGKFLYNDANTATMGAIIEKVSGMPVEQFIKKRILEPLGMNNTYTAFSPQSPWAYRMNSTYRFTGKTCSYERYWDNSKTQQYKYFRASGGIYSTPMDYARFLSLWMNKGFFENSRLLSEKSVKTALYPYADRGDGRRYGMFWTIRNTRMVNDLPAAFGHGGSDNTVAICLPEIDAMALFFTQSRNSKSRDKFLYNLSQIDPFDEVKSRWNAEVEHQWNELLNNSSVSDSASFRLNDVTSKELEKYTGIYSNGGSEFKIFIKNERLYVSLSDKFDPLPFNYLLGDTFISKDPCGGLLSIKFLYDSDSVYRFRIMGLTGNAETFNKKPND